MNVRLGEQLLEDLIAAREMYGLSNSKIAAKALRLRARLLAGDTFTRGARVLPTLPCLDADDPESTYGGESIKLGIDDLAAGLEPRQIRLILRWFLDIPRPRPADPFRPDGREGRYIVVEG